MIFITIAITITVRLITTAPYCYIIGATATIMVKTDAAEASDSEPTNGTVATAAAVKEVVTSDFDITREEKCESCDCYNVNEH